MILLLMKFGMGYSVNDKEKFSRAGDVLKDLFDRLVPEEAEEYSRFFTGWEKIAGAETAMHVFPRDIVKNVLILETDHPGWTQQIRMRQESLLKEIRKKYPDLEIKKIRVVIGYNQKQEIKPSAEAVNTKTESENYPKPATEPTSEEEKAFFGLLETMRKRSDS